MLLGTTTIIVVVGGCKSIIPIFKEVTPEKNGWNKYCIQAELVNQGCILDNRLFCVWLDSPSS